MNTIQSSFNESYERFNELYGIAKSNSRRNNSWFTMPSKDIFEDGIYKLHVVYESLQSKELDPIAFPVPEFYQASIIPDWNFLFGNQTSAIKVQPSEMIERKFGRHSTNELAWRVGVIGCKPLFPDLDICNVSEEQIKEIRNISSRKRDKSYIETLHHCTPSSDIYLAAQLARFYDSKFDSVLQGATLINKFQQPMRYPMHYAERKEAQKMSLPPLLEQSPDLPKTSVPPYIVLGRLGVFRSRKVDFRFGMCDEDVEYNYSNFCK